MPRKPNLEKLLRRGGEIFLGNSLEENWGFPKTQWLDPMETKTKLERSQKLIMTDEARVLRLLRQERGLTLRQVSAAIGMSHTYIAHIEAGRMAVPGKAILMKMLGVYGIDDYKVFYDKVRNFKDHMTPRQQLLELIEHLNDERIDFLLKMAKGLAEGKMVVLV